MVTNFFRIDIPFDEFQIQRVGYSEERFLDLRKKYNKDASFFRSEDHIYISPRRGSELDLGETVKLSIANSSGIVLSLIRHLVFRFFRDEFPDRVPESFSPLRFFSTKDEHDLIRRLLPINLQGKISYLRMVEVEARRITESGKPSFGLLIRSRQRWKLDISLRKMVEEGFSLTGKNVLESHPIPGLEGILAPDESLLGEVVGLQGDDVEIISNNGKIFRKLDQLQLQRSRNQIGEYLAFKLGAPNATRILRSLREDSADREQPAVFFDEARKFAKWFSLSKGSSRIYENDDGFCFKLTSANGFDNASVLLHKTNLVFDYGPGASSYSPYTGLSKFGPFNAARFERNDLRVLALFHPQSRGAMTQFLKQLIDGIPESRYFQRGLKSLFRLNSVHPILKEVVDWSPEAFEKAIEEAVAESDSRGFDIALIEGTEEAKLLPVGDNPYYRARARLMSYGIPTQGVKNDHLRLSHDSLQWSLGPMSLQMYAKVGGTPWRLPGAQSVDREIVVGIGHTLDRPNLWSDAKQSKVVGITTFFLGDGSYMLGERLKSVPYADYFEELLKSLKGAIEHLSSSYAWRIDESVRIVFHIFKPVRNVEVDVVSQLIDSFPQFKILFAFVTISTDHPWMMFRNSFERGGKLMVDLCERGDNLILDSNNCLLQIRGDKDRPNKRQRPPFPVSIRVHEKSTFRDLKYIAQQIHDFAYLSWRGFFPSEIPVTVFYSSLIAKEANRLSKIPNWNPGFVDKHFRQKQWFL